MARRVGDVARQLADRIQDAFREAADDWAQDAVGDLRGNTGSIFPYDTGAASRGFSVRAVSDDELRWYNETDYAVYYNGYVVDLLEARGDELERRFEERLDARP